MATNCLGEILGGIVWENVQGIVREIAWENVQGNIQAHAPVQD